MTILQSLEEEGRSFTELRKKVGWARQTLDLYLKALMEKGCVERREQGRRVIYSLNHHSPYVMKMLRRGRTRMLRRVDLSMLYEEESVSMCLDSVNLSFLNILQDYMLMGEVSEESVKNMHSFLEAHLSDLAEVTRNYGELMIDRIRSGSLKSEKIWETRNKMLSQIWVKCVQWKRDSAHCIK